MTSEFAKEKFLETLRHFESGALLHSRKRLIQIWLRESVGTRTTLLDVEFVRYIEMILIEKGGIDEDTRFFNIL